MTDRLLDVGELALGILWTPMLVWTVVAGVALLWLRRRRGWHPLARYRLTQALLFALPVALTVGWLTPVGRGAAPTTSGAAVMESPMPGTEAATAPGTAAAVPTAVGVLLPGLWGLSGLAAVGAFLLALGHLARIPLRIRELGRVAAAACPIAAPEALATLERLRRRLGVRRPVALLEGPGDSVPMSFGWRRPVVVVPAGLTARPDDLRMTLVHELVHLTRHDFAWAVAETLVRALFAFHPLVRALTRDIRRHREASCDLEVLATDEVRPAAYAGLLFTFGAHVPPRYGLAAGLAAPTSQLRERIETMKSFSNRPPSSGLRTALGAAVLLATTSLLGACFSFNGTVPEREAGDGDAVVAVAEVGRADAPTPSSEGLERALDRLDAQIAYLSAEIDEIDQRYRAAEEAMARGGAPELTRRLMTRAGLLHDLYEERVREYELLKLEQVGASAER